MIEAAKAVTLIAWLALGLCFFAFVGGGVLVGIAMAEPDLPFTAVALALMAGLSFGWWKLTVLIERKLNFRN